MCILQSVHAERSGSARHIWRPLLRNGRPYLLTIYYFHASYGCKKHSEACFTCCVIIIIWWLLWKRWSENKKTSSLTRSHSSIPPSCWERSYRLLPLLRLLHSHYRCRSSLEQHEDVVFVPSLLLSLNFQACTHTEQFWPLYYNELRLVKDKKLSVICSLHRFISFCFQCTQ